MDKYTQVQWEDVTDIREVRGVRITVNDLNSVSFYKLPKAFFHNPKYLNMNSDAKIAYSILTDLLELSARNGWINENGEIYVKLSREKLMLRLNIKGTQKMTKVMKQLQQYGLIEERQIGLNRCNEIYICKPIELSRLYNDEELARIKEDKKQTAKTVENKGNLKIKSPEKSSKINGDLKIKSPEIRKSKVKRFENQRHTNTNTTKTNITNISSSSNEQETVKYFEENICKLGVTTKKKFLNLIEGYSNDYIKAVIDYQSSINTKSYKGFEIAFNNFKSHNIDTVDALQLFLDNYNKSKTKKKTYSKNTNKEKKIMFNDFTQREYDYDSLEKKLLGWDND